MPKAPLRSELETALNELVAYEGGMRFQGLAVVLAKQHWPELVASERKKDFGLDAYVTSDQATDGVGRGLACSITATYKKIAEDADTVTVKMPGRIQKLMFATSQKVSTGKKRKWEDKLRQDLGYELIVMSREDILTSLTDPKNIGLCRTYLHLDLEIEPSIADIVGRIHDATNEELTNWTHRLDGQPLIDLRATRLESSGEDRGEIWTTADVAAALQTGSRLVLEGPAGCGKTTTLVELARGPLAGHGAVLLVDLPLWIKTQTSVLGFISGTAAFQRRGLTAAQLAQAEREVAFQFLLNGWNEVAASQSEDALLLLRQLEHDFPAAGVLVATRAHHIAPPLPGATRLRLLAIGRRARTSYVRQRLDDSGDSLLSAIKKDPALDALTRTPFVLSQVVSTVAAGKGIPRSRVAVLEAAVKLQEDSPTHQGPLRSPPLVGMSSPFLEELARLMMARGGVNLTDTEARIATNGVAKALASDGRLLPRAAPSDVLNALSAHHVLERFDYPEPGYRFSHQLFQEYYAFRVLSRRFAQVQESTSPETRRNEFIREFLNDPAWTDPLQMLAEHSRTDDATSPPSREKPSADLLIEMSTDVDLVFSAELASLSHTRSNATAAQALASRIRNWHTSTDEHHRNCALAATLASGMDSFRDIIEPLLSSDDDQIRYRTHRLWPGLNPTVLGADWPAVVAQWSEPARATFVSEILFSRYAPDVAAFGLADPSPAVKEATIDALGWIGADEEYERSLANLDDSALARVLADSPSAKIPADLRARSVPLLRVHLAETTDTAKRFRALLRLQEMGDPDAVSDLKAGLEQIPEDRFRDLLQYTVGPVLDALRTSDPEWTSRWVAQRIADGKLWSDWGSKYLTVVPDALREEQFVRLSTQDLEHRQEGPIAVVAKTANPDIVRRAFLRLLEVWRAIEAAPRRPGTVEGEVLYQLEDLLRSMPIGVVLEGLREYITAPPERESVDAFVHLYGRTTPDDSPLLELDEAWRGHVRRYLKSAIDLVLAQDDFAGEQKAELATALSLVAEREDLDDIMRLVRADLTRVSTGRAARARGEQSPAANGAPMSWTGWYVRAIVRVARGDAIDALLSLVGEREYEGALREEFGRQFSEPMRGAFGRRTDYEIVWRARAEPTRPLAPGSPRARVAGAILSSIAQIQADPKAEANAKHVNRRLKEWALALAAVAPRQFSQQIIDLLSLPADFDAHTCVQTLKRLLFAGATLPSRFCLPLLDSSITEMKKWGVQNNERWTVVGFLQVCPFVDDQAAGLEKIRELISQAHLSVYDLRDVLPALGHSRFDGSFTLMSQVVGNQHDWSAIQHEWIEALIALDTVSGRGALLGLVDPELPALPFRLDWSSSDLAVAGIAAIAAKDQAIDRRLIELSTFDLDEVRRQLLARTLAARGTPDAQRAVLALIDDSRSPRIPQGTHQSVERTFVEERTHTSYSNAITRHPSVANPIREAIYQMVFDDARRARSAYSLIGQIEEWRLEYGRAISEPRRPSLGFGLPWPPPQPQ